MAEEAPAFLSGAELDAIHRTMLTRYGGFVGVRDEDALTATLAAPGARMNGRYVHEDLPAMAAAYLYQIARYRPFVDGNRRTAVVAALVFLALNDRPPGPLADIAPLADLARGAAAGEVDKAAVALALRGWLDEAAPAAAPTGGP